MYPDQKGITRPFTPSDHNAVKQLLKTCFTERNIPAAAIDMIVNGSLKCVVHTSPEIVGVLIYQQMDDEAEIIDICVHPGIQRQGIGSAMLMELMESPGFKTFYLEVDEMNIAAIALYKRSGFHQTGERKNYYRMKDGTTRGAITMKAVVI